MAMIHVNRGATSLGAFPEEQVKEGIRSGRFLPTDLGWREGMATWQPLSQFAEFAAETGATGAPQPPPQQTVPAAPIVSPGSGADAGRTGLPWDQRASKGFFSAFIETLQMVLTKPTEAFSVMKREGGLGEPLIYALVGGFIGGIISYVYSLVFQSIGLFSDHRSPFAFAVGASAGSIAFIIFLPLAIILGLFIGSAIVHLCLLIVGGANRSFETTFRVLAFSQGSTGPLQMIPVCGGLIAGVWALVVDCIGLARAHETDTWRAVLAIFLPLIVCCGGIAICVFMFGALGAWNASQH